MDNVILVIFLMSFFCSLFVVLYLASLRRKDKNVVLIYVTDYYKQHISHISLLLISCSYAPLLTIFSTALQRKAMAVASMVVHGEDLMIVNLWNAIYQIIKWFGPLLIILIWLIFLCMKLFLDVEDLKHQVKEGKYNKQY